MIPEESKKIYDYTQYVEVLCRLYELVFFGIGVVSGGSFWTIVVDHYNL